MQLIQRLAGTALILLWAAAGCEHPKETPVTQSASSASSSGAIVQRTVERRGVEAVIWGMPAVNFDRMYQAMVHDANAGEGSNKIVYWSRPLSWKNQTLTPNPDTIYLMPFFNTKDVGPMVLEIPPADYRLDHRLSGRLLADRHRGRRPRRGRQGKRRQVPDPAPRLQRPRSLRIHPHAVRNLPGLCTPSVQP